MQISDVDIIYDALSDNNGNIFSKDPVDQKNYGSQDTELPKYGG
jgi:hypothetical protein